MFFAKTSVTPDEKLVHPSTVSNSILLLHFRILLKLVCLEQFHILVVPYSSAEGGGGQGRNFGIGGPERPNAHSDPAEGEYDGVLTSSSIVKLYFNSYTHTIGILDEMKY